jgi:hypothetical protein
MNFDPSVQWISKSLPADSLKRVLDTSLAMVRDGCYAHLCLILRAASRGILRFDLIVPAIEAALPEIRRWAGPVLRESRILLSALVLKLPSECMNAILSLIAVALKSENAEAAVYVFADFVLVHYARTTAPFHAGLYESLQDLILGGQGSLDMQRMFAAICTNPVRFLRVVQQAKDRSLFNVIANFHNAHLSLYNILFAPQETPILRPESVGNSFAMLDDSDDSDGLGHLSACLRLALHPARMAPLVDAVDRCDDEDVKEKIIEVVLAAGIAGREPELLQGFAAKLPNPRYGCDYTDFLTQIRAVVIRPTNFEKLRERATPAVREAVVVGSRMLTELAVLFQFVLWSEKNNAYIPFIRTRVHCPEWFVFVASSLFASIFRHPVAAVGPIIDKYFNRSTLYIVWFAIAAAKRLETEWMDALADERMEEFCRLVLYPRIEGGFAEEEVALAEELHQKYQNAFAEIEAVVGPAVP